VQTLSPPLTVFLFPCVSFFFAVLLYSFECYLGIFLEKLTQTTKGLNQNRQFPEEYRYRKLPDTNLDRYSYTSFLGVIPWEAGGRRHCTCGAPSNSKFPKFRHCWSFLSLKAHLSCTCTIPALYSSIPFIVFCKQSNVDSNNSFINWVDHMS